MSEEEYNWLEANWTDFDLELRKGGFLHQNQTKLDPQSSSYRTKKMGLSDGDDGGWDE